MPARLRFGICADQNLPWADTVQRWRLFEELGFDSAWDCDHYIQPSRPDGPYFEAWTLLAGLATVTKTIRIGVLVSCNTFRHPYLLAKEATTVDHISGGRLEFGFGAGWYEPEHVMIGTPLPEPAVLVSRFRESVEIVDGLFQRDSFNYAGKYYQLNAATLKPAPVQRPRPPFTLGAHGPRMLMTVAKYADVWNSFGEPDQIRQRNEILNECCESIGRDPMEIRRSIYYWVPRASADPWDSPDAFDDIVGRYREVGINEFIMDQPRGDQLTTMERIVATLLPRLRGGD